MSRAGGDYESSGSKTLLETLMSASTDIHVTKRIVLNDHNNKDENDGEVKDQFSQSTFEVKYKKILYSSEKCLLMILRDISQLVQVEYARSVEKLSSIMVATASHDMRTPLNTIINMHKLIEK